MIANLLLSSVSVVVVFLVFSGGGVELLFSLLTLVPILITLERRSDERTSLLIRGMDAIVILGMLCL